ncbi:MAG TPA: hypothetical protein VGF60_06875 [Xanthobacteraceae bacterium]|jgi:hypothetical protein
MKIQITGARPFSAARCTVASRPTAAPDEFRAHAAECHEIADSCHELIKEQYEALSRLWLMVAEQAERQAWMGR